VRTLNALEALMGRRSIRKYTDKKIPEEKITTLLKAAMNAPSGGNRQPWHFIVVNNHETLVKITDIHPYSKMLEQASHAIIVLGDTAAHSSNVKEFWVQDCSAAIENILIAAHAIGLGAVWLGGYPNMDIVNGLRNLFKIPDHIVSLGVISLGYPGETKPPRENYTKERVHMNKW
jgi:nitroreductase